MATDYGSVDAKCPFYMTEDERKNRVRYESVDAMREKLSAKG